MIKIHQLILKSNSRNTNHQAPFFPEERSLMELSTCTQMTSQKRAPSETHTNIGHFQAVPPGPFLPEVTRTLYGNAQFAISSAGRFSVFRSVPVLKFEERPGKYTVEQIKTLLKCKGLKQSGK